MDEDRTLFLAVFQGFQVDIAGRMLRNSILQKGLEADLRCELNEGLLCRFVLKTGDGFAVVLPPDLSIASVDGRTCLLGHERLCTHRAQIFLRLGQRR